MINKIGLVFEFFHAALEWAQVADISLLGQVLAFSDAVIILLLLFRLTYNILVGIVI